MEQKPRSHTDLFKALEDLQKLVKIVIDVVIADAKVTDARKHTINKNLLN
jgi:polyhydroxyalkanoate synthesis regulator protein